MATAKQFTLFSFEDELVSTEHVWLEGYDGGHKEIYRMDAEAMTEDRNRINTK